MREERPDVVGTFGPDGITGHPDHVRIGAATDEAFDRVAAEPGRGLRRLVHGALPQSVFERWNETRRRKGMTPWDPDAVYHLRGVPDEQIGISVDTSSVALRVVAGLREHRSQQHVIAKPDVTDKQWSRRATVSSTGGRRTPSAPGAGGRLRGPGRRDQPRSRAAPTSCLIAARSAAAVRRAAATSSAVTGTTTSR